MKRFAANKIFLSEHQIYTNAVIELSDTGVLTHITSLSESSEIHSTPFFNGIILPFSSLDCQKHLTADLSSFIRNLFNGKEYKTNDTISALTLISSANLFSSHVISNPLIKEIYP